jgi:very-short-patch-repair endonuclease
MVAVFKTMGIPAPVTELKFHPSRKFRFDYAWPEHRVAVEINGGVWSGGRHTRGAGYLRDMEKINSAQEMGWVVLQYPPNAVDYDQIKRLIEWRH